MFLTLRATGAERGVFPRWTATSRLESPATVAALVILYGWTLAVHAWAAGAVLIRAPYEFLLLVSPFAVYGVFIAAATATGGFRYIGAQEWQAAGSRPSRLLRFVVFFPFAWGVAFAAVFWFLRG